MSVPRLGPIREIGAGARPRSNPSNHFPAPDQERITACGMALNGPWPKLSCLYVARRATAEGTGGDEEEGADSVSATGADSISAYRQFNLSFCTFWPQRLKQSNYSNNRGLGIP